MQFRVLIYHKSTLIEFIYGLAYSAGELVCTKRDRKPNLGRMNISLMTYVCVKRISRALIIFYTGCPPKSDTINCPIVIIRLVLVRTH